MNIKEAKEQIKNAMTAYFTKDELGEYVIPIEKQRPVFLTVSYTHLDVYKRQALTHPFRTFVSAFLTYKYGLCFFCHKHFLRILLQIY